MRGLGPSTCTSSPAKPAPRSHAAIASAAVVVLPTESVVLISMSCLKMSCAICRVDESACAPRECAPSVNPMIRLIARIPNRMNFVFMFCRRYEFSCRKNVSKRFTCRYVASSASHRIENESSPKTHASAFILLRRHNRFRCVPRMRGRCQRKRCARAAGSLGKT